MSATAAIANLWPIMPTEKNLISLALFTTFHGFTVNFGGYCQYFGQEALI
jgi:hypothetical protein